MEGDADSDASSSALYSPGNGVVPSSALLCTPLVISSFSEFGCGAAAGAADQIGSEEATPAQPGFGAGQRLLRAPDMEDSVTQILFNWKLSVGGLNVLTV
ncbi:unnamed protein product [Urochloa humidicola]